MNKEKFKEIFNSYFDAIRNYVFYKTSDEELAQDIAQDVFTLLWKKKDSIELTNVKALLYKMASDLVITHYRKNSVRLNFSKNIVLEETDNRNPTTDLEYEDLAKRYTKTLESLTPEQREVFLMSREESMKYHEIAERLGLSVKAIEKRMSTALKILKENLLYIVVWILITLK